MQEFEDKQIKMSKTEQILKKVLLFLFPWRDALGIYLAGIPLRFGEIWSLTFFTRPLLTHRLKISKKEGALLLILLLNLFVTLIGIALNHESIDTGFAMKYVIRNVMFIIMFLGFLSSNIVITKDNIRKLMVYYVILNTISFIILMTTGIHLRIGKILTTADTLATGQYVNVMGRVIPRFLGNCSEAGYLAPLIVIPIYFFLNEYLQSNKGAIRNKDIFYLAMLFIMAIFTFSAAVYVFAISTVLLTIIKNIHGRRNIVSYAIILFVVAVGAVVVLGNAEIINFIQVSVIQKIKVYFSLGTASYSNWSANDRSQHITNAWNMFKNGNIIQIMLGNGTGAYSAYTRNSADLLVTDVNEAYNIYLSTLTDRGILGLGCVIAVLMYTKRYVLRKDIYSMTIYVGIIGQFLHWIITGNFWLYYFWYEILILVGYYRANKES